MLITKGSIIKLVGPFFMSIYIRMPTINFSVTQSIETLAVNLSASEALVMNINNPLIGASYFGLETIPDNNGVYTSTAPKNTSGSFTLGTGILGVVRDDYKMGAVVSPGNNVLTFSPAITVTGVTLWTRGIGADGAGAVFDVNYRAVLAYAATQGYTIPSARQQSLQNQLLVNLKAAGVWDKLDTFAVFATDGSSNFALIDWKRLTQYTAVNSPTFTANQGFTGNGTSNYIDTNFNPATNGVNYTLDNASRFLWVSVIPTSFKHYDGNSFETDNNLEVNVTNRQRINQTNLLLNNNVAINQIGLIAINRSSTIDVVLFNNNTQISRTASSTSIRSTNQFVGRSYNVYSNQRTSIYGMGASLVSENTALQSALNTYLTSL